MNFGQAVSSCFSNYVTFSGRATRSEFWYWILFCAIGSLCASIADGMIIKDLANQPMKQILTIATILPGLAVSVRRLHDVNKNGWWFLIMFTGIGILLLIYWYLLPSEDEETDHLNRRPLKKGLTKNI